MRCRPGIVTNAEFAKVPDLRCTADALHRVRDTSDHARQAYSFSRRLFARALSRPRTRKLAPGNKREAKRRKAHANHVPRNISKRRRLLMYRRQVYAVCATYLLRGCAPYGARSPSGASTAALAGTPIPAQLQAMLPGELEIKRALPALSCPSPVTAPHASAVIPKGMMPKAAPERVASPRGGTALAPLPKVPSRRRPLMSEMI